ncbi:MAG TPA: CoA transferase [Acidimicrobiales bacterium]|jgi:crotonobetainyl-CoA:carnitine CoA-transferase CaiB-like acyl-CoA transferase|nr:CoA transferase [Acidimicrobiales bacterium]
MTADVGVFAELRVLDLSQGFAGALCTMVLGDNGASVIRAVPLDDELADPDDACAGALQWHRSKLTVALNPLDVGARAMATAWLDDADIVVATAHAPMLELLDGDLDGAVAARPRLVGCFIDAFGDHRCLGGLPLNDGAVLAAAGRMADCGRSFRLDRPAYVAPPLPSFGAGNAALHGILAALHERHRTGRGQLIRTSLARGLTIFDFWGPTPSRLPPPNPLGPHPALGYIPARTKDGRWIQWANWAPHLLWHQLDVLGLGHLRDDETYRSLPQVTPAQAHALWQQVLDATQTRTADEWMALLTERGTTGGDVLRTTIDGMDHPQARFNGNVIAVDVPGVGATEQIGPIAEFDVTPGQLGVHEWARPAAAAGPPGGTDAPPLRKPLEDIVVLEAASMIATPVGSVLLADLGARVIKIEPLDGEPGRSLPFTKTLQGKESIAVDIKSREGLEIVQRLVARADVFLHNYRPGVPEKLGIDDAALRVHNPRLVYLYAGAYGKAGPYAKMPAYHPVAGAICGNAARQAGRGALDARELDDEARRARSLHLSTANEGHPDPVTGALVATVLLLGLTARDRFGVGQEMTTTMLCASAYLMSADWIRYDGRVDAEEVDAELLGTEALNRLYRSRDGWLFLSCRNTRQWRALAAVLERPELARDDRYATLDARRRHDAELSAELESVVASLAGDALERDAIDAGVACVRADRMGFGDFQRAEIAEGRTALARRAHSSGVGEHWRAAPLVDMRGVDAVGGASLAGEHTVAILEELGYSRAAIDDLLARNIVRAPSRGEA